jgi:hypothetical protein
LYDNQLQGVGDFKHKADNIQKKYISLALYELLQREQPGNFNSIATNALVVLH